MVFDRIWPEFPAVLVSLTEDPLLQIAGAAALVSAVAYPLLFKSSEHLSPRICTGYRKITCKDEVDWNTRLPSTVHAVVVTCLSIYALWFSGKFFNNSSSSSSTAVVFQVSELSYAIVGVSAGYFMADAWMLMLHPEIASKEISIHHAVALLSLAVAAQVHCMHVYLMLVLLSELTTPFVNLRFYLDKAGLKDIKLYVYNGMAMALVWGVARVVLFFPFYAHVLLSWESVMQIPAHAIVLLLGVPLLLFGLNVMWFSKIVRGALKLLSKEPQPQPLLLADQVQQKLAQQHNKQQQQGYISAGKTEQLVGNTVEIMAYAHQHAE